MIAIRLWPMGSKRQKSYRVVVADVRSPVKGKYIESIGIYEPQKQPSNIRIDEDRARYWLGVGAKPTGTVVGILKKLEVLDDDGRPALVEGSYVDPLVKQYLQILRQVEHNFPFEDMERFEIASKLAVKTRNWEIPDEEEM